MVLPFTGASRGRVIAQMWSIESTVTPLTAPSAQSLGKGFFGHAASTWNVGTSIIPAAGLACARAILCEPKNTSAASAMAQPSVIHIRFVFIGSFSLPDRQCGEVYPPLANPVKQVRGLVVG